MTEKKLTVAILGKGDFGLSIGSLLEYNNIEHGYITRSSNKSNL
jgi:glycerol-3-phosphate dehydrogenase